MSSFEAYQTYLAIKLYFKENSKYDFFKFNGKINVKVSTFEKRRDRYWFEKLARTYNDREELIHFLLSNIVSSNRSDWVGNLFTDEAEKTYMQWKKKIESLTYVFSSDLEIIERYIESTTSFTSLFKLSDGIPPILRMYLKRDINIETIILMNRVLGFIKNWERIGLNNDLVCEESIRIITKYDPFIQFDTNKAKKILKDKLCPAKTKPLSTNLPNAAMSIQNLHSGRR